MSSKRAIDCSWPFAMGYSLFRIRKNEAGIAAFIEKPKTQAEISIIAHRIDMYFCDNNPLMTRSTAIEHWSKSVIKNLNCIGSTFLLPYILDKCLLIPSVEWHLILQTVKNSLSAIVGNRNLHDNTPSAVARWKDGLRRITESNIER